MQREITSRDNPFVKQFVRLSSSRAARREEGLFVTEGIKLTGEALSSGYPMVSLYMTAQAAEKYADALRAFSLTKQEITEISGPVAEKMAQAASPQGVFGVFRMLDKPREHVTIKSNAHYLLLCGLQDPGNLGTILRTAAAFGVDGVFLSPDCPDPFSPKVLRASMGGVFKLPLQGGEETTAQIAMLRGQGVKVYAAALTETAQTLSSGMLRAGCAVVIGNEGAGLSPAVMDACDGVLQLPMQPDSESLNAAMAAGIFLWEMTRPRPVV